MAVLKLVRKWEKDNNGELLRRSGTKLVVAETGEMISGIEKIEFTESCNDNGKLIVTLNGFELDAAVQECEQEFKSARA